MSKEFFTDNRIYNGLGYQQYLEEWDRLLKETDPDELNEVETNFYNYRKLNRQRTSRIHKTYKVSEDLKSHLNNLDAKQIWMVLTENWCGDSAQTLPYIAELAKTSENIKLRILYRDENLDIMDQYLTNGKSRSIPKLVSFDEDGNELFQWGPRPKEAQSLVSEEISKGREKHDVYQDLHLWYNRNKGKAIEKEFIKLLETVQNSTKV
ncbi:MAG: thioredoxin family protein [Melioribacteraceae bacterium]|nr:thioredoxin family protein [Melioribacteraceae bacterium]